MHDRLIDYSSSRKLPTGRRIFVLQAIQKAADSRGDAAIADKCAEAITTNRGTLGTELTYSEQKNSVTGARGDAAQIDTQIDERLVRMHKIADSHAVGDDEVAKLAAEFLAQVYPDGLGALVNQEYENQLIVVESLLERFDGDLAEHVDVVGLRRHVDVIAALTPKYRVELERDNKRQVTFTDVKESRARGHDAFAAALFAVLSTYDDSSDPRHVQRREDYLVEYHRQNDRVAEAYRRRMAVEDVDPDTGEPVDGDQTDEDVPEPVA